MFPLFSFNKLLVQKNLGSKLIFKFQKQGKLKPEKLHQDSSYLSKMIKNKLELRSDKN